MNMFDIIRIKRSYKDFYDKSACETIYLSIYRIRNVCLVDSRFLLIVAIFINIYRLCILSLDPFESLQKK